MTTDAITAVRETIPALFKKGVDLLDARAADGSEKAKAILEDIRAFSGAAFIQIDGEGQAYLNISSGAVSVGDAAAEGLPVKVAVGISPEGFPLLMEEIEEEGVLDDDAAAVGAARLVSKRMDELVEGREMEFHVTILDVPDVGEVTARVGFNVSEPPAEPKFKATMKFDDLEDLREGDIDVKKLFMGGKLRMEGDYSVAIQLLMKAVETAS